MYGKSSYKKENGAASYSSSLPLAPGVSGNNRSRGTAGFRFVILEPVFVDLLYICCISTCYYKKLGSILSDGMFFYIQKSIVYPVMQIGC